MGDCDAKLQAKSLGSIMKKNGVSVYLAAEKNVVTLQMDIFPEATIITHATHGLLNGTRKLQF